jgi:hypothetical protein
LSLLFFENVNDLCCRCAKPGEQAITNKRIEENLTPAVGGAAHNAKLNTNCGVKTLL